MAIPYGLESIAVLKVGQAQALTVERCSLRNFVDKGRYA
jgi:hypothetical protein